MPLYQMIPGSVRSIIMAAYVFGVPGETAHRLLAFNIGIGTLHLVG